MSRERFQTQSGAFESSMMEELENPFKNMQSLEDGQESYNVSDRDQNELTPIQAETNLLEGEISITKNSLSFDVPIEFNFSGKKFWISISSKNSVQKGGLTYTVNSEDKSGLKVEFIIVPRPLSVGAPHESVTGKGAVSININTTNNLGSKANATLIYHPDLEKSERTISDLNRVLNNIKGTHIGMFLKALPLFDSLGPVNPKSVLTNPMILLGPTLNSLGFQPRSFSSEELEEGEFMDSVKTALSAAGCAGAWIGCVAGLLTVETGVGAVVAAAACGAAPAQCLDAVDRLFPIPKGLPSKCPEGSSPDGSLPGNPCVKDNPRSAQDCPPERPYFIRLPDGDVTCSQYPQDQKPVHLPPIIERAKKPFRPTMTAEQIRWVQAILRVAAGESELKVDGLIGPKTREAIRRFQRRFNIIGDGLVSLQTATALSQLGLNHIAKQSRLAVDGIMGPKTKQEIKIFQSTYNSGPIDGIVGPITRAAMTKLLLSEIPPELISTKSTGELYQESEGPGKWYSLHALRQG